LKNTSQNISLDKHQICSTREGKSTVRTKPRI